MHRTPTLKSARSLAAPRLALTVSTVLASLALAGCTAAAPRGDISFASAQAALQKGEAGRAIIHAEAAVLAEPRNPGYRALLGAAYLDAGRFASAATAFGDALDLGDQDPRTVLSYALAKTALGDNRAAAAVLDENERLLDPADLGLALALAGQPERGTHVLINAVRASDQGGVSPKLRQNLAYAYALAGNWRAARVMAAEDVPADQLDARLSQWAAMAAPENFQQRVAALLGVAPAADNGQPAELALANFPTQEMMVAEAAAQVPVTAAPSPDFAAAFEPAPAAAAPKFDAPTVAAVAAPQVAVVESGPRYVSNPVVQALPAARANPAAQAARAPSQQRRMAATSAAVSAPKPAAAAAVAAAAAPRAVDAGASTHLVQLGSYDSKVEAERGWTALKGKFPQLKDRDVVITQAVVNGRTFWRVAAAGFGATSARALCGTLKSAGRGCFAYAASSPPAGAVKRADVRVAARTAR